MVASISFSSVILKAGVLVVVPGVAMPSDRGRKNRLEHSRRGAPREEMSGGRSKTLSRRGRCKSRSRPVVFRARKPCAFPLKPLSVQKARRNELLRQHTGHADAAVYVLAWMVKVELQELVAQAVEL